MNLYSPTFSLPIGSHYYVINVKAKKPFSFYANYPYFNVYTYKSRQRSTYGKYTPTMAHEWLTRSRRTVLFTDTSLLVPYIFSEIDFRDLHDSARKAMLLDHCSYWKNTSNIPFLMVEPYITDLAFKEKSYEANLLKQGLSCIVIPVALSPYCGRWSNLAGALPGTRAFLIADARHNQALNDIAKRLQNFIASGQCPPWNSTGGIQHVFSK